MRTFLLFGNWISFFINAYLALTDIDAVSLGLCMFNLYAIHLLLTEK